MHKTDNFVNIQTNLLDFILAFSVQLKTRLLANV